MSKKIKIDITKLTDEQLIKQYHYLIVKIVGYYSKFQINYNLYDDMYQECCLTLLKERINWDRKKGEYSTFIYKKLCSSCGKVIHKFSYAITMTNRNFFTNKKRLYKIDEEDLIKLHNNEDNIEREEQERLDHDNICKIYNNINNIQDKKIRIRIVKYLKGELRKLSDNDIKTLKDLVNPII